MMIRFLLIFFWVIFSTSARSQDLPADKLLDMGNAARARVTERHAIDTEAAKLRRLFLSAR